MVRTMPLQPLDMLHAIAIGIFPNEQNWRIGNSHIATDTLIAIIKAQRQNFPRRV